MGIATHIAFDGFSLVNRLTARFFNSNTNGFVAFEEGDVQSRGYTNQDGAEPDTYFVYNAGQGFTKYGSGTPTTYNFTDEAGAFYSYKYTTHETSSDVTIRSTTTYEASSSTYFFEPSFEIVSTTWEDITTTNTTRNRTYTEISATDSVPFAVPQVAVNRVLGVRVIIEPKIGTNWTVDGSALEYYQLFTDIGSYVGSYSNNYFDSNLATTIYASEVALTPDVSSRAGSTVYSTYERIVFSYTSLEKSGPVETIVNGQLYLTSIEPETIDTVKKVISSSTFSYVLGESFAETTSTGQRRAVFAERITTVYSTATHYQVDNLYTYNSFFTYSGLIETTAMYSYSLGSAAFGTRVVTGSFGLASTNKPALSTRFYVDYYAIALGTSDSRWNKYYTQAYALNQFALASKSGSPNRYAVSVNSPYNVIFKSYKFDVIDDFSINPKIYIPINTTEYSYTGTDTDNPDTDSPYFTKTIQSVDIPSGFYYGATNASVSRTTYTVSPATILTSSNTKVLGYIGNETTVSGPQNSKVDFQNQFWNPPNTAEKIMHTIGVLGKSSASYNMDGYIVYNSNLERTFAGDSKNPISIIGNGQITTIIGSSLVSSRFAFPYVLNKIYYVNSYG